MTSWQDLDAALDAWHGESRMADFWWRDDDAHIAGPALDRLLRAARRTGVPVAIAVVPAKIDRSISKALADGPATILQHGYAHRNMAPPSEKRSELGVHRPTRHLLADLAVGHEQLSAYFGPRAIPVLVPPWNRISSTVVPMLPEIGFRGLSRFAPRRRREPVAGFLEINAHIDVVDWKEPLGHGRQGALTDARPFVGVAAVLGQIVAHLEARRAGRVDPDEPTGLLTHHLVHSEDAWRFIEAVLERISRHPGARWRSAADLFAL